MDTDYRKLAGAMFREMWDVAREGGDFPGDEIQDFLAELGLIELREATEADREETGEDELWYPTDVGNSLTKGESDVEA